MECGLLPSNSFEKSGKPFKLCVSEWSYRSLIFSYGTFVLLGINNGIL